MMLSQKKYLSGEQPKSIDYLISTARGSKIHVTSVLAPGSLDI